MHLAPLPPPLDGGIAAYIGSLRESTLAEQFELQMLDVRAPQPMRKHRALRPLWSLQLFQKFHAALGQRPDLVHIHLSAHLSFWEKGIIGVSGRRRGRPFVLHLHGGDFDVFMDSLSKRQQAWARRIFGAASGVILLAHAWKPRFAPYVDASRLHVIPNAIHVDDFSPGTVARRTSRVRILFVGMVSVRKGLDELRQAILTLRESGTTNFDVDIVGGEEVNGELLRYRKSFHVAGLDDCVQFHGYQDATGRARFLQSADIFVLPSRNESFGIVNLEAMASGLAVISTRTGAIPEYIESGTSGLLIDVGDVPALVDALHRLINDEALRHSLGGNARDAVAQFDWRIVAQSIAKVYRDILAS